MNTQLPSRAKKVTTAFHQIKVASRWGEPESCENAQPAFEYFRNSRSARSRAILVPSPPQDTSLRRPVGWRPHVCLGEGD